MSEAKKKLFDLFRSRSSADKEKKDSKTDKQRKHRRERPSTSHSPHTPYRESTRSPHAKSEPRRSSGAHPSSSRSSPSPAPRILPPLTEWPPQGMSLDTTLSQGKAMELISSGVPVFKGHVRQIAHSSSEYYNLYATTEGNGEAGSDGAAPYHTFSARSFKLQGHGKAKYPWETLEQPSLAFCYGTIPGTVTLNHWVTLSGHPNLGIELIDPGVKPREVELDIILERLIYLETNFEEDSQDLLYKNLYTNLLKDPDRILSPHKAMEKQIVDLITVLSGPQWIDFSKPENQVVAKYFCNGTYTDNGRYKRFFHQLLLGMELDVRIMSGRHKDSAKEKLLEILPPKVKWDLALARRWRECMVIEKFNSRKEKEKEKEKGKDGEKEEEKPVQQIRFRLLAKKSQVKSLHKFAKSMKWPNLTTIEEILKNADNLRTPLENSSSDSMSYFTGVILPGPTLPWLIMNSLIDLDSDAGSSLSALTHIHPNSGFQYRSTTYWSATCIVGKVLAPTCRGLGGWIGPARPAPDLDRIQIARIRQRKPKQILSISDVKTMTERSDPLGPPSSTYPVEEYTLPLPDFHPENRVDTIRIEKLGLKPLSSPSIDKGKEKEGTPKVYDAAVQFAVNGRSWPLRLSYDVSFITGMPCKRGPHPLFFDYKYKIVRVDEILRIRDWGGLNPSSFSNSNNTNSNLNTSENSMDNNSPTVGDREGDGEEVDRETVLVVEAFGVEDNEVLVRAWCSHWGLSALVVDFVGKGKEGRNCVACVVREAYAACVNVVVCVDSGFYSGV